MPFYSFTNDKDVTIEEWFWMGNVPDSITKDNTTYKKDVVADFRGRAIKTQTCWPMVSESMGVTEAHIPEAQKDLQRAGIDAKFTPDGGLILNSPQERKRAMKHLGYFDKAGYY